MRNEAGPPEDRDGGSGLLALLNSNIIAWGTYTLRAAALVRKVDLVSRMWRGCSPSLTP